MKRLLGLFLLALIAAGCAQDNMRACGEACGANGMRSWTPDKGCECGHPAAPAEKAKS